MISSQTLARGPSGFVFVKLEALGGGSGEEVGKGLLCIHTCFSGTEKPSLL